MTTYQKVWNTVQSKVRNDGGSVICLKWTDKQGRELEMNTDAHTAKMMEIEIIFNGGTLH